MHFGVKWIPAHPSDARKSWQSTVLSKNVFVDFAAKDPWQRWDDQVS